MVLATEELMEFIFSKCDAWPPESAHVSGQFFCKRTIHDSGSLYENLYEYLKVIKSNVFLILAVQHTIYSTCVRTHTVFIKTQSD
jgi:hypothetical protein